MPLAHLRKAGQCPGGAERVGDGDRRGDALALEAGRQIGGEGALAAPQMGRAGDLDPHPVRAVGRGPRAVAAAPFGQPAQRRHIFGRLGRGGGEAGQKGERVGQRHSRGEAGGGGCRVDRGEQPPPGGLDHRGERRLLSRRGGIFPVGQHARGTAHPVDRPTRQPEIQDPSHPPPPPPSMPARRRGSATARPASADARSPVRREPGRDGSAAIRQRVAAAFGRSRSRAACAPSRQRRSRKAVTPERSAASCSRRLATAASLPTSPTTAATPAARSPSSIAHRISSSRRARTSTSRAGIEPKGGEAGPVEIRARQAPQHDAARPLRSRRRSGGRRGCRRRRRRRARHPPRRRPLPRISCTAPRASPPPGKARSIAATPNGNTPCTAAAGRSIRRTRSRSSEKIAGHAIDNLVLFCSRLRDRLSAMPSPLAQFAFSTRCRRS